MHGLGLVLLGALVSALPVDLSTLWSFVASRNEPACRKALGRTMLSAEQGKILLKPLWDKLRKSKYRAVASLVVHHGVPGTQRGTCAGQVLAKGLSTVLALAWGVFSVGTE